MRKVIVGILALALVACGNPVSDLAEETCSQLEDSIVLTAGIIISRAIEEAERLGSSGPELGDAMRETCPDILAALEKWADEQEARSNLINEVSLKLDKCTSEGAKGTVTNNSSVTVDVFVDVEFLNANGVVVDSGLGLASGLRPGETGKWEAPYFGDRYSRCRAEVSSVFES